MRLGKMRYRLLWVTGDLYSSNTLFWRVFGPMRCLQWLEIHGRGRITVRILIVITSRNDSLPGFATSTVESVTNHHPMSQKKKKHVAHFTAKFLLSHNCWPLPFKGWLWIDSGDRWQTSSLSLKAISKGVLIWVSVSNCVFLIHPHHSTKKWFGSTAFSLFQFHWTPCLSPCWAERRWCLAEEGSEIRLHEIYDVTAQAHFASWIMVNHCWNQRLFTSWLS